MSVGQRYEYPLENAFNVMDKIRYLEKNIEDLIIDGNAVDLFQLKKKLHQSFEL